MHLGPFRMDITGIHTWRQCQTMWNIRNFTRNDANILNPRVAHFNFNEDNVYRYEFPVMQWSIAMILRLIGEDIRIVRASVFVIACLGIWFFYQWMRALGVNIIGALGASLLLQYSSLFYLYCINPIPDVLAFSAGIAYLFWIFKFFRTQKNTDLLFSLLALTLAAASKLPYLMFGVVSLIYLIQTLLRNKRFSKPIGVFIFGHFFSLLPMLLWYVWVIPGWKGNGVLHGIFDNRISWGEVGAILSYHIRVMFPQILMHPYSVLLLGFGTFILIKKKLKHRYYLAGLLGICLLYLILQFNMINTIHDYYMMPFLPVLYAGIGVGIDYVWKNKHRYLRIAIVLCIVLSPVIAYNFNKNSWTVEKAYSNPDFMNHRARLQKAIPENERMILINDRTFFINTYMVDKMGYVFYNDYLPWNWIDDLIRNKGVHFMYSDSRKIDEDPEFQKFVKRKIMKSGSVRVFELQLPN